MPNHTPALTRVVYPGELPPIGDVIVTNANKIEVAPDAPHTLHVGIIAQIALRGYVEGNDTAHGVRGEWRQEGDEADSPAISVHLVASEGAAPSLQVVPEPDDPNYQTNAELVKTRDGHQFYLVSKAA